MIPRPAAGQVLLPTDTGREGKKAGKGGKDRARSENEVWIRKVEREVEREEGREGGASKEEGKRTSRSWQRW